MWMWMAHRIDLWTVWPFNVLFCSAFFCSSFYHFFFLFSSVAYIRLSWLRAAFERMLNSRIMYCVVSYGMVSWICCIVWCKEQGKRLTPMRDSDVKYMWCIRWWTSGSLVKVDTGGAWPSRSHCLVTARRWRVWLRRLRTTSSSVALVIARVSSGTWTSLCLWGSWEVTRLLLLP